MDDFDDAVDAFFQRHRKNTLIALAVSLAGYHYIMRRNSDEKLLQQVRLLEKKAKRSRSGIRKDRRVFDHWRAWDSVMTDVLNPDARLGDMFEVYYRLSRARVQVIMEAFGNSGELFYAPTRSDAAERRELMGPSFEVRVLLPLKTMAYGVAPHTFSDYYQVSMTMARNTCRQFWITLATCFKEEFLRLPDAADLRSVTKLHEKAHGLKGMIGSIDCMHTHWKNCPVAWQQSFQGKEGKSTIVLEAVADYYLWFWHASYGYAGTMTDNTILHVSPLFRRLTDGSFAKVEKESGVVPFDIGTFGTFHQTFMLADGIYPPWSRFLKSFKEPVTVPECRFSTWQEGARKDVERAFGVLQGRWQAVARPIHTLDADRIQEMMTCAIILHNMGVSDRVMGDVRARYDPGSVEFTARKIPSQREVEKMMREDPLTVDVDPTYRDEFTRTGIAIMDPNIQVEVSRDKQLKILTNKGNWRRLLRATLKFVDSQYSDPQMVDTDDEDWWETENEQTDDDGDGEVGDGTEEQDED